MLAKHIAPLQESLREFLADSKPEPTDPIVLEIMRLQRALASRVDDKQADALRSYQSEDFDGKSYTSSRRA
jgi:hypothetical protein